MAEFYRMNESGTVSRAEPEDAFLFLTERKHVISLVGGGGKSTLMYFLAAQYARQGLRTLVTTTTHIYRPDQAVFARDRAELLRLWEKGSYAVIGTPAENGKLSMPDEGQLAAGLSLADAVLIEADGAKHQPCKAPAESEPVLLPESDLVIGMAGLTALGRPLREVCFRPERVMEVLDVPETHILTEADLAMLLSSPAGARKNTTGRIYYAVLNQCDSPAQQAAGSRILHMLREMGTENAVMARLRESF